MMLTSEEIGNQQNILRLNISLPRCFSIRQDPQIHSLGFFRMSSNTSSGLLGSGLTLYLHAIKGGAETMTDSILPFKPKRTPLSYNRLNSKYLPRLKICQFRSASEKLDFRRASAIPLQLGRKPSATEQENCIIKHALARSFSLHVFCVHL